MGVASYADATRAESEASRLAARFPDLFWTVAPAEVAGTVYYRVLGGLLPDSMAAMGVGGELARGGVPEWIVRRSGRVVELGTWETADQAASQRAAAREDGIPAYLSRLELTDGSARYAVYAGAYAGVEADVVSRMGRPPS